MTGRGKLPIEEVNGTSWRALDKRGKLDLLESGCCMAEQGVASSKGGEWLSWGKGFRHGHSPVPVFALEEDLEALEDALALGACPFARDAEDEGAIDFAFSMMDSGPASERAAMGAKILSACWSAGAPLLDPSHARYLGDKAVDAIKFDIALGCFRHGASQAARSAGAEIEAGWIVAQARYFPLLSAQVLGWGRPIELELLWKAGLDLVSPMRWSKDQPAESLWGWIHNDRKDPVGVARVLLMAGNDPRVAVEESPPWLARPSGGHSPLDRLRAEPAMEWVARRIDAMLLASDERKELAVSTPGPAPGRKARGI